jgi:dCTP diphosphatase
VPCARSRQTLVAHDRPSTVAFTGVRPQACVAGGARPSGMRANIHPPGPGYRHSAARNVAAFTFAFATVRAILSRAMTDVHALLTELRRFVAERDWAQFHDPKNLTMLLASEVGELVAEYRWVAGAAADEHSRDGDARARIADEIGDVGIALLLLCDRTGIDLGDAVTSKLAKNRTRYPVDKSRGKPDRPDG